MKESKQVRVGITWHKNLKILASRKGKTISRLIEEMLAEYYKNNGLEMEKYDAT